LTESRETVGTREPAGGYEHDYSRMSTPGSSGTGSAYEEIQMSRRRRWLEKSLTSVMSLWHRTHIITVIVLFAL